MRVLALALLLVVGTLHITDAKSKRGGHADTTITHKVFFDVEIDGHKAGLALTMDHHTG